MLCSGFSAEDYGLFALDGISGPESDEIRSHLSLGCERCYAQVHKYRQLWYLVALAAPQHEPPPALRARILGSIGNDAAAPSRRFAFGSSWRVPAGVLAILLAVLSGWFLGSRREPEIVTRTEVRAVVPPAEGTRSDAQSLEKLEREIAGLRAKLAKSAAPVSPPSKAGPDPAAIREELARAHRETAEERERSQRLESEIARQKTLVAAANQAAQEAGRNYEAAVRGNEGQADLGAQLAALRLRSQQLEQEVSRYKALLAVQRQKLERGLQYASLLADPGLRLLKLRGTEKSRNAEGHVLVSGGSQVVFYGSKLPPLPPGRTYQLWLIRRRGPAIVSAGLFEPDRNSRAFVEFDNPALTSDVTAIAVTDEPAGGSEKPTGHKFLIGS